MHPQKRPWALELLVKVLGTLGVLMFAVMALQTIADSAMRTLFSHPLIGSNEITQYWLMPGIVFLGLAVAQARNEHIHVTVLYEALTPTGRLVVDVVAQAITIVFVAALIKYGYDVALGAMERNEIESVTGLITWPPKVIAVVGLVTYLIVAVYDLYVLLKQLVRPAPADNHEMEAVS